MKKIILIMFLLSISLIWARVITLEEAVNIALENSYESQQNNITQNKVNSSYKSTLWDIAPDGSISYNWSHSDSGTSKSAGLTIGKSINSTLPDYFNWRTARHNIEVTNINSDKITKSIAWNVLSSYVDLLLSQKKMDVYTKNYQMQLDILKETNLQKELGRKTIYEYNQVEINALNSELNLLDAQKNIIKKIKNLSLLLNIEADTLSLQDIDLDIKPEYEYNIDQEKSLAIIISELSIEHNKLLLNQDKLRFLPDLSVSWSYYNNSINNEPFEFDNYQSGNTWRLSLSYPLLNYFKQSQSHYRNKENLLSEKISLYQKIDEFKTNYQNYVSDLENLFIRKGINDKILRQSQQNFEIAKTNFNLGLIKSIELEQTKTDLREAELNNLDIDYQIYLQQEAINHLLSKKIANKW
ncbi:TolC family protein [bacterium]|nr:TolC family protein [bacterium]